ncbi:MAG: hydrogenase maturation nickel metallochaperone HypA [Lachnospiraceae bacterium]|nr:hydrogenase maturation nickel metallochaperone HypA [Lachnospiraceae bacterium]
MNENLQNEKLDLNDLERVSGGKYRPQVVSKNDAKLKRVFCKNCGAPFMADPDDLNPKCPFCPDNQKFSV